MNEVHILSNMFWNLISCEIILPMYFEIRVFKMSLKPKTIFKLVFKLELDFQNNSVNISVQKLNQV